MAKKHRTIKELLPFVAVLMLAVLIVVAYAVNLINTLWIRSLSDIFTITEQGSNAFELQLLNDMELTHYLALNFAHTDSHDTQTITANVSGLNELSTDYYIVDLESGMLYSNHSEIKQLDKDTLERFTSTNGCLMTEPIASTYSGNKVLSCYEIFRFSDGVKAIVHGENSLESISELYSLEFYDGRGFSNIINSDGKILVKSNNKNDSADYSSIFDLITLSENDKEDVIGFREALSEKESGVAVFTKNGDDYVIAFVPLEINDWYYISIIPSSVIMASSRDTVLTESMIILSVIVAIIAVVILIYEVIHYRRKLLNDHDDNAMFMSMMNELSTNTNVVFMMIDPDNYHVQYVSQNVERVLGIPAKVLQTDIKALSTAGYADGSPIDFNVLNTAERGEPITLKSTRKHGISGDILVTNETVYRLNIRGEELILIVIGVN